MLKVIESEKYGMRRGGGVANERNVKWSHHMDIINPNTSRDYLLINRILLLIAAMLVSLSLWNVNNLSPDMSAYTQHIPSKTKRREGIHFESPLAEYSTW